MKRLLSKIKFIYIYIISSIGFYPTIISLAFVLLAVIMLYMESLGISETIKNAVPMFIINDGATARLILSSITTGIISLTVFSFTMVVLVLNQASSNFSPRVIPGLISYKANQRVMGLYLGTLIYTLIVMVNIHSDFHVTTLPGFSIFLAMFFTIVCLGFFVYFIHSISVSIQIESILESIYKVTRRKLEREITDDSVLYSKPETFGQEWYPIKSPQTGYLQSVEKNEVARICKKFGVVLCFQQPLGSFYVQGIPFAVVNKELQLPDEFTDDLFVHLNFYREERPDVNYLYGFKHITESAVRALSPSLNDPGTAIKAIDYLTDLFILRMELSDERAVCDDEGQPRILFLEETYEQILSLCLSPIRLYSKKDSIVLLRLLYLFRSLVIKVEDHPELKPVLYRELLWLLDDADKAVANRADRAKINEQVKVLNAMKHLYKTLPLLKVDTHGEH